MNVKRKYKVGDLCGVAYANNGSFSEPYRLVRIVAAKANGDLVSEPRGTWSPTGRARSGSGVRLVTVTPEQIKSLWVAQTRDRCSRAEAWADATPEQLEAVAKAMGWPTP